MAHMASFTTHDRALGSEARSLGCFFSGEAVSLEGISRLLGQPTRCGLRAIIKILASLGGCLVNSIELFGFKKQDEAADPCYKTSQRRSFRPPWGRRDMHALAQWWRRLTRSSVRHAWGLAPQAGAWALVGLTRQSPHLARVDTLASLQAPQGQDASDRRWLSQHLRQNGRASGRSHRLNMALPAAQLQEGHIDFPADFPQEDWPYEVQLEVSQALQLAPDEVNFDFEVDALGTGLVRQIHWAGCARSQVAAVQKGVNDAGWRLSSVEPAMHAAKRAAKALVGGLPSLIQQAPQDWQFRWHPVDEPLSLDDEGMAMVREAGLLQEALASPAGPRLVACGLALKAWS